MLRSVLKYWLTVLSLVVVMSSCTKEDQSSCPEIYNLKIKAVDNQGNNISATGQAGAAIVYVFDQNKGFLNMISVTEDEVTNEVPIEVAHEGDGKFWIVVWSNLSDKESVTTLTKGMLMSDALVKMTRDAQNNAINPDDLFWGTKNVDPLLKSKSSADIEVPISRVTAKINIKVKGLDPQYESEYRLEVVDALYDTYDFEGNLRGNSIKYVETGLINSAGIYTPPAPFLVFPVKGNNYLTVLIYKNDELITAVQTDNEDSPIAPQEGKTENIFVDLGKIPTSLSVKVIVSDWTEVYQWLEW